MRMLGGSIRSVKREVKGRYLRGPLRRGLSSLSDLVQKVLRLKINTKTWLQLPESWVKKKPGCCAPT